MPVFHALRVADVRRETDDTVSVAFTVPDELAAAYEFAPGQHVAIRMPGADGAEVRRSYSICSGLDDGELRVAVKHIAGGVFGVHANERLKPGDVLDVMTPAGRFTTALDPANAKSYLGIAAGSGITPVISLIRSVLAREPKSRFTLVYGNRGPTTVIFRESLEDLKDRYLDRLQIIHVFSREQQHTPLLNGRIDADKMTALAEHLLDIPSYDEAFVCGPEPMTLAVRDALVGLGMEPTHVHLELFGSHAPLVRPPRTATTDRRHVTVILNGIKTEVAAHPDDTLLEAGQAAGLDLPFSCRGGVCATCRAKVLDGAVAMDVNYALEQWETDAGFVLTCQSRPTTDAVVVDYDAV
ncbi:MAG: phenylacetate-CoA oxygenase/reductase subunit PaaK [Frankiaceae bacterium]|nr:phenylacetate-CoA oxygenase/reductase subunit PaaK [Frankiaceae bacterium]MBV9368986.1 phenylacetate-CoA oxygenase/reductase subunit PaaK [Frankiales bacterium]